MRRKCYWCSEKCAMEDLGIIQEEDGKCQDRR